MSPGRNPAGNFWPLTTLWLNGNEKYADLISDCLPLGITPWWFDVQNVLTSTLKVDSVKL